MSDTAKTLLIFFAMMITVALFLVWAARAPQYPKATGLFPQVITCLEHKDNPNPPAVTVKIKTLRKRGEIKEYRAFGCRIYYYHDRTYGTS